MKINKKPNTTIDLNTNSNSLQNNQKKDNFKNLNQRINNSKNFFSRKFFKDLGIVESVGDGIINILGLQKAANGEMVEICASEQNQKGLILNLGPK
jgi:F0F1-type ATP synthase alpha subunit